MKRLICMIAGFTVIATPAFAQSDLTQGHAVYFREGSATNVEALGLIDQISRALDKSRRLRLVTMADPEIPTIELQAPTAFTKEADGRVTVSYEMRPARGDGAGRTYKSTCKMTQLDRCAEDIVTRLERYARDEEAARTPLGLPSGF